MAAHLAAALLDSRKRARKERIPGSALLGDLQHVIDEVHVYTPPIPATPPLWQVVKAALLEATPARVERLIEKKNALLNRYRTIVWRSAQPLSHWLVIYSGSTPSVGDPERSGTATVGKISGELKRHSFRTDFDKVFFLDTDRRFSQVFPDQLIELTTTPTTT